VPPWQIEALDKAKHARKFFCCGVNELDRYLTQTARQAANRDTGRTYVAVDLADRSDTDGKRQVAGYFTLAMTSLALESLPQTQQAYLPNPVPAALLARLAVDQRHQGQGLGGYLLINALHRLVEVAEKVAAHAIVVDALNQKAKDFYLKYEFIELTDDPMHLFLPMETARQLKP
jgi:GNAT superfamily N-acetyltransferase